MSYCNCCSASFSLLLMKIYSVRNFSSHSALHISKTGCFSCILAHISPEFSVLMIIPLPNVTYFRDISPNLHRAIVARSCFLWNLCSFVKQHFHSIKYCSDMFELQLRPDLGAKQQWIGATMSVAAERGQVRFYYRKGTEVQSAKKGACQAGFVRLWIYPV